MVDGFRVTESGDRRTTTAGDTRITERFQTASAALNAIGSVQAVGSRRVVSSATFAAAGDIDASALRIPGGEALFVSLSANSQISAAGRVIGLASSSLSSTSAQTAIARRGQSASATLGMLARRRGIEGIGSRVTEDGEPRVCIPVPASALTANATLNTFAGLIRVKRGEAYFDIVPFAKVSGDYVEVPLVYIKTGNAYMRAR